MGKSCGRTINGLRGAIGSLPEHFTYLPEESFPVNMVFGMKKPLEVDQEVPHEESLPAVVGDVKEDEGKSPAVVLTGPAPHGTSARLL